MPSKNAPSRKKSKGYYAKVKFENDSRGAAELFHVGAEINQSSKKILVWQK